VNTLRVVLFSGGRGGTDALTELVHVTGVQTSVIVNGFDDGKSTGEIRSLVHEIWGPSDFRKVGTSVLQAVGHSWADVFEERGLFSGGSPELAIREMRTRLGPHLPTASVERLIEASLDFWEITRSALSSGVMADMALGNTVLTGLFLRLGDFETALAEYQQLLGVPPNVKIINVFDGSPSVLGAATNAYSVDSEHGIVESPAPEPIQDLFFHDDFSAIALAGQWQNRSGLRRTPLPVGHHQLSPLATSALEKSDVVIVAPGTRHSSTLPSLQFKTKFAPKRMKQILVMMNGSRDFDFHESETVVDEVRKISSAMLLHPGLQEVKVSFLFAGVRADSDWANPGHIAELRERGVLVHTVTSAARHGPISAALGPYLL